MVVGDTYLVWHMNVFLPAGTNFEFEEFFLQ